MDIDSKEVLENALIDFDGTLLFVSHDRYFINRVATHVLELSENGSTLYLGDYDYYVEKKAEVEMIQTEEASTSNQAKEASPVNDYQAQKESQKEVRKLMRQIENLEAEIEELESQSQAISEQMLETNDDRQTDGITGLSWTKSAIVRKKLCLNGKNYQSRCKISKLSALLVCEEGLIYGKMVL